jgi:hypothetical protein
MAEKPDGAQARYGGARAFGFLAIRAFRTGFCDDFRICRQLLIPATVIVFLLFPLWGILHPRGRTLIDLLPPAESPAQG